MDRGGVLSILQRHLAEPTIRIGQCSQAACRRLGWVSAKAHEFIAEGSRVVPLGTYSGTFKKTGRSFSAAFAHVWPVRGDRLASFNMHTDTAKVLEAVQS
jgi:hypothetical protein